MVRKKTKEGNKEKKVRAEEVVGKKMKKGNKEKKLRVRVWRRKKRGEKREKEIWIKNKIRET